MALRLIGAAQPRAGFTHLGCASPVDDPKELGRQVKLATELIKLTRRFRERGAFQRGSSLLIPPHAADAYLDAIARLGIGCLGLDGWYYIGRDKNLAADRDVDFFVGSDALYGPNPVQESIARTKEFLRTRLLDRTVFVAFTLDIPRQVFEDVFLKA